MHPAWNVHSEVIPGPVAGMATGVVIAPRRMGRVACAGRRPRPTAVRWRLEFETQMIVLCGAFSALGLIVLVGFLVLR